MGQHSLGGFQGPKDICLKCVVKLFVANKLSAFIVPLQLARYANELLRKVFPCTTQDIGSIVDENIQLAVDLDGAFKGLVDALLVPGNIQLKHRSTRLLQVLEALQSASGCDYFVSTTENLIDKV